MIVVDSRDGSRDLADLPVLEGHHVLGSLDFDVDGSGKLVPCGDAMLTGNGPHGTLKVGVELKQLSDLLSSISTGRLGGTQIPRMLHAFDMVFLLTYGQYRVGPQNFLQVLRWKTGRNGKRERVWANYRIGSRNIPWAYLEGFILSAQIQATLLQKPLFHKHCYDINEAAHWLRVLDNWLDKPWEKHRALSVFDKSREMSPPPNANPVEAQIARTVASLPGVDWVKGWSIARHFDSVEEVLLASKKELQEVKGIGPVIAGTVHEIVRRRK